MAEIQSQTSNKKNKAKILLVDDESDHCLTYQIILQDAGYECESYTDSDRTKTRCLLYPDVFVRGI